MAAAGADTEVVRLLEQALRVAESHARSHGIDPPGPELGRVVQWTVESYQHRT